MPNDALSKGHNFIMPFLSILKMRWDLDGTGQRALDIYISLISRKPNIKK